MTQRTAKQAILDSAERVGRKGANDFFTKVLPHLEARLVLMQSVTSVKEADVAVQQLISSVNIYGSENLELILERLRDGYYSSEQLPDAINAVCIELKISIKVIKDWLKTLE